MNKKLFIVLALLFAVQSLLAKSDSLKLDLWKSELLLGEEHLDAIILEAKRLISQDSIIEGIRKIAIALKSVRAVEQIDLKEGYFSQEILFIFDKSIDVNSTPEEQNLLESIFYPLGGEPKNFDRLLKKQLKANKKSETLYRYKLFSAAIKQDERELENTLREYLTINDASIPPNLLKATLLFEEGKWVESINYFTNVLKAWPQYSYAYLNRAIAYHHIDKVELAIHDLDKSLEYVPGFREAIDKKVEIYNELGQGENVVKVYKDLLAQFPRESWIILEIAEYYSDEYNLDSALVYFDRALIQDPDNAKIFNLRGDLYYNLDIYDKALIDYNKSIDLDPKNIYYYRDRGNAYAVQDNYDEALKDFFAAYRMNSGFDYVVRRIADMYYFKNDFINSKRYSLKAIELDRESDVAYRRLGLSHYQLAELDEALKNLKMAFKFNPEHLQTIEYIIRAYNDRNEEDSIIFFIKDVLDDNPDEHRFPLALAIYYGESMNADSAFYYFDRALAIETEDAKVYNDRGDLYYDLDQYEEAIRDYTQSIMLDPDNENYYKDRGNAYYYKNKKDSALIDFRKAIKIYEQYDYVYRRIGDCFDFAKEYDSAIYYYKKAIEIDPEYYQAMYRLGMTYYDMGEFPSAIKSMHQALEIKPDYNSALGNLGWIYYCVDEFENCIIYSEKAIKDNELAFYAKFNVALAKLRLGFYEESILLYRQYLTEAVDKERKYSGAIEDLKELIEKGILVEESNYIIEEIFGE